MTLLWAARRGLMEDEMLELLGGQPNGEPLPRAYWSPLYLAAEHALTIRGGLIGFFHDYIRRAVEHRYLPEQEQQQAAHRSLAEYFAAFEPDARTVDELPWQLAQAEASGGSVHTADRRRLLRACLGGQHVRGNGVLGAGGSGFSATDGGGLSVGVG